jgi:hypothetical protein
MMSYYDMKGQKVKGNQYIAGRDMNFGAVQNTADLADLLEGLRSEVVKAKDSGIIDKKKATDVEYQITKATQETEEPKPDKKTILDHLTTARSFIEDIAAAGGLVTTIAGAIEAVQKLFS